MAIIVFNTIKLELNSFFLVLFAYISYNNFIKCKISPIITWLHITIKPLN